MESGEYILPSDISAVPGPYSFEYTPFFREPMRRLSRGPVKVGIESGTQIGKSVCLNAVFAYCLRFRLGPILMIMPRETDIQRRINTRWKPMFRASPDLMQLVPGGDLRNVNIGKETVFANGVIAFIGWAGSPAALADNPVRTALIDEPGKFDIISSTGEDPFDLIDNRQRSYAADAITFYATSPQDEGDLSDVQFRSGSDARYWVPCIYCQKWHLIGESSETLIIDKKPGGEFYNSQDYLNHAAKAWYACPHCGRRWSEVTRAKAVKCGEWVHKGQIIDIHTGRVSGPEPAYHYTYRINSLMVHPRFWTAAKEAAKRVAADAAQKRGDLTRLRDYVRNQKATPWREMVRVVKPEAMADKVTSRPMGTVPAWCRVLTASSDYHQDESGNVRVEWAVYGWGQDLRNALIAVGYASSMDEMFFATCGKSWPWHKEDGQQAIELPELTVSCGFADAGYQPNAPHDGVIDVVYDFCLRYRASGIWLPCKGGKPNQVEKLFYRDLDRVVSEARQRYRRKYAGQYRGMRLVNIAVSQFKDMVTDWAKAPLGAPASTEFPEGLGPEYWPSFCNEVKVWDPRGRWIWQAREGSSSSQSHKLDLAVYAAAAGWHIGVNRMWSPQSLAGPAAAMVARQRPVPPPADRIEWRTTRPIRTKY